MSISKKDVLRYACALVAGIVSTLLAHTHSFAESADEGLAMVAAKAYLAKPDSVL